MSTIEITDNKPVKTLVIPVPEGGGVVELLGRQECGKSASLDAIARLGGDKSASVECRDGAAFGRIAGLGVEIIVRRSVRRQGALEAVSIAGRLSIDDLVDPGIKDPVAADARRIKAVLKLSGVEADPARFEDALGPQGDWADLLQENTLDTDDLCEMAARIKRDFERDARDSEGEADKARATAAAHERTMEGVDLDGPSDGDALQAELEEAIAGRAAVKARQDAASLARENAVKAETDLKEAEDAYEGPTLEDAINEVGATAESCDGAGDVVAQASRALDSAKEAERVARVHESSARDRYRAALSARNATLQYDNMRELFRSTIAEAAKVAAPSDGELSDAETRGMDSRAAVEQGVLIRAAQEAYVEGLKCQDVAAMCTTNAKRLRKLAASTDDSLSAAVASDELSVKHSRLVTQHPDRGETLYAERSTGHRYKLAIGLAVKRIKAEGEEATALIPVCQAAWGELQPANKQLVRKLAREHGVTIFTARADDGDLRAEVFEESTQ